VLDPGIDSTVYNEFVKGRKEIARSIAATVTADSAVKATQLAPLLETRSFFSAGELARVAGVSTDTLRHYERKGVLPIPPRARNRYRTYPAAALDRVKLIRGAMGMGFTLDELASILKERDRGGAPCLQVRNLAAAKLADLEIRLSEMTRLRDDLRMILGDWDGKLSSAPAGGRAALLETLPDLPSIEAAPSRRSRKALRPRGKRKGNRE
jgi:DNA-binding transcriptional MerR regulator